MSLKKDIRKAVDTVLSSRGYDDYPADRGIYKEGLDEIAEEVMKVIKEHKNDV